MPTITGRSVLAVGLLAVAACAPVVPPIAETGGDLAFKRHIAVTHGPGTPGAALRAELLREGFTILDEPATGAASALFRPGNPPCWSEVRIDWREDRRGRVTAIQAARHSCT